MLSPADVLSFPDVAGLRRLLPVDFEGREMTLEELAHIAGLCDGYWVHNGDPKMPHAKLASGLCSNSFIDSLKFLMYPELAAIFARQLADRVKEAYEGPVDWVVGSANAAITFSYKVAEWLGAIHGNTEKIEIREPDGKTTSYQVWRRHRIEPGQVVLGAEELSTTNQTPQSVRDAIREGNPQPAITFAPVTGILIDRSVEGITTLEDSRVVCAFRVSGIWAVKPEVCTLCAQGSRPIAPKKPQVNWDYLTGRVAMPDAA